MSLLLSVITAHKARSTHHRIVLDALDLLDGADAERWRNLFLAKHQMLLDGAKAPDTRFKDFKNHVYHVGDGGWGGAPQSARNWYDAAVTAFKAKKWTDGVFAIGVLSHYYADPLQPFHTGQTEAEGAIHRAVEWSLNKSYPELKERLTRDHGGYPSVATGKGETWVEDLVRAGAEASHPAYQLFIDHYDLDAGVKDPPAGLDDAMRDAASLLLGRAVAGVARLMERARDEAQVTPPKFNLTVRGYVEALDVPLHWVTKRMDDQAARKEVERAYGEFKKTGRVRRTLSSDDKKVRALHAKEVLGVTMKELNASPVAPLGAKHGQPEPFHLDPRASRKRDARSSDRAQDRAADRRSPPRQKPAKPPKVKPHVAREHVERTLAARAEDSRIHLRLDEPVEAAPSIGEKTAARLADIGVRTVADLMALDPGRAASELGARHITTKTIREWQVQADLVMRIPNLRGHDAQILTACGVFDVTRLALLDPKALFAKVDAFMATKPGQRLVRTGSEPTLHEVRDWIRWANEAREFEAA